MRIPLDRDSSTPLYRQIHDYLKEQIASGALPTGTRLPPTRELAQGLGLNRLTVTTAYDELEAAGLIYSHVGRGTFVAPPLPGTGPQSRPAPAPAEWPLWQRAYVSRPSLRMIERPRLLAQSAWPGVISFAEGTGGTNLYPVDEWRKTMDPGRRRQVRTRQRAPGRHRVGARRAVPNGVPRP